MKCPNCGGDCERDEVDNGVGLEPAGVWGCPACHWVQASEAELVALEDEDDDDEEEDFDEDDLDSDDDDIEDDAHEDWE